MEKLKALKPLLKAWNSQIAAWEEIENSCSLSLAELGEEEAKETYIKCALLE